RDEDGHINSQYASGLGGHLVDVGFLDFVNRFPPPKDSDYYPEINFNEWQGKHELVNDNYIVFTTGAVAKAREVPGHYWNPIIEHVKSLGITPVFLGTKKIQDVTVKFPEGCHYDEGIDLRDKTTIMDA